MRGVVARMHQNYDPYPFVKCCCNALQRLFDVNGVDFIILGAYLMFLVVVFMYYGWSFMFSYLNTFDFFQNMI